MVKGDSQKMTANHILIGKKGSHLINIVFAFAFEHKKIMSTVKPSALITTGR